MSNTDEIQHDRQISAAHPLASGGAHVRITVVSSIQKTNQPEQHKLSTPRRQTAVLTGSPH